MSPAAGRFGQVARQRTQARPDFQRRVLARQLGGGGDARQRRFVHKPVLAQALLGAQVKLTQKLANV
jgi:hypothetical protein